MSPPRKVPRRALQPADAADATYVSINLGTFNFGINQDMLGEKAFRSHIPNLQRVFGKLIDSADLDMCFGCEVGGHKQGLRAQKIELQDILAPVVGKCSTVVQHGYVGCWNFAPNDSAGDASQLAAQILHTQSCTVTLPASADILLAINHFKVQPPGGGAECELIVGNMHIECGKKPPTETTRCRIVSLALRALEDRSDASHPVVMVLCGDCNLAEEAAKRATQKLQPTADAATYLNSWIVQPALGGKSGDVLFYKGAKGTAIEIPVGYSYDDRGVRNDCHDAFGVKLIMFRTGGASQPADLTQSGGATQPAGQAYPLGKSEAHLTLQRLLEQWPSVAATARPSSSSPARWSRFRHSHSWLRQTFFTRTQLYDWVPQTTVLFSLWPLARRRTILRTTMPTPDFLHAHAAV